MSQTTFFPRASCGQAAFQGEEEEEEEDVPEDLADLEPEEQQKRIKPIPQKFRHFKTEKK